MQVKFKGPSLVAVVAAAAAVTALTSISCASTALEPAPPEFGGIDVSSTPESSAVADGTLLGDSLAEFPAVTDIPGSPIAVRWGTLFHGGTSEGDRLPGPTDLYHLAVVDYGDPATVAELLSEFRYSDQDRAVAPWYPSQVLDLAVGGRSPMRVYRKVHGFPNEVVFVPIGADNFVIFGYRQDAN